MSATFGAIMASNSNVKVSGGEVKAIGYGRAISTGGNVGDIEISGGTVSAISGQALFTDSSDIDVRGGDIVVRGGVVSSSSTATGAILSNGSVTVSDGVVRTAVPVPVPFREGALRSAAAW